MSSSSSSSSKKKTTAKGATKKKKATRTKKQTVPLSNIRHVPPEYNAEWMNIERTRLLTKNDCIISSPKDEDDKHCIIYWMQRDVRSVDNWALLYAGHLAKEFNVPLKVVYVLPPPVEESAKSNEELPPKSTEMNMTERFGTFFLGGLRLVEKELRSKYVPFTVLQPESRDLVGSALYNHVAQPKDKAALAIVCDFDPLEPYRDWMECQVASLLDNDDIPLIQVDAHNVIPVWVASTKREVGARTLRPKINNLVPTFMTEFPEFMGNSHLSSTKKDKEDDDEKKEEEPTTLSLLLPPKIDWEQCQTYLKLDNTVPTLPHQSTKHFPPGTQHAMKRFHTFCQTGLSQFHALRNDPNHVNICSNLSPWLNRGHVSFQRLAMTVRAVGREKNGRLSEGIASYVEEGLVRRELSDNFVFYTRGKYDSLEGAADWARETLEVHEVDQREWVFGVKELEEGRTHDDLWNAAQLQLVREGGLHGFLRMYWAKKILEWSPSPQMALRTAQYFNDRYALDGNDPNGYVGVGWSIMGIHDMGWKERPVFGKIRYMNYAGCKRKFDVKGFVDRYEGAQENALMVRKRNGGVGEVLSDKKKTQTRKRKGVAGADSVKGKTVKQQPALSGSRKKLSKIMDRKKRRK